jgi:Immunity protein 35
MTDQFKALSIVKNYIKNVRKLNNISRELQVAMDLTIEKPYGWIFTFENKKWVETRDDLELILGFPFIVVMKESEEIFELPSNQGFDVSLAEFETEHSL